HGPGPRGWQSRARKESGEWLHYLQTTDQAAKMPLCKYYVLGKCLRGDSCYYSHSIPHATTPPETERRFAPDQSIPLSLTACNNPRSPHPLHPLTSSSTDTRSTIPCHFFSKGRYTKGISCPFAHNIGGEIPQLAGLNINRGTI